MSKYCHYVGERYSPHTFITEAAQHGVSRRAPLSQVKNMEYGDTCMLLQWNQGQPVAFAEFRIQSILLQGKTARLVTDSLTSENRAWEDGGGEHVDRECGEYDVAATYYTSATIEEICHSAEIAAAETGEKPWVMVGGPIYQVFRPELFMDGLRFFQGFAPARGYAKIHSEGNVQGDQQVTVVMNYEAA